MNICNKGINHRQLLLENLNSILDKTIGDITELPI